jgi:DNA-binding FadR family transcriptional regulator
VRIAGVRVSPSFVRLLAQLLEDAGFDDTAEKLADAIRMRALEAPLTIDDHDAILTALGSHCPSGLARLRRELLDESAKRRRRGL